MARANSSGRHLSSPKYKAPSSATYSISPPFTSSPPYPFYEFSPPYKLSSPPYKPSYPPYESSSPPYKPSSPPYKPSFPPYEPSSPPYKPSSPHYKPSSASYNISSPYYMPPAFYNLFPPPYKPSYHRYSVYKSSSPFARKRKKCSSSGGADGKELGKKDVAVREEEVECLLGSFNGEEQLRQVLKSLVLRDAKALGYVRKEANARRAAALQEILGDAAVVERAYLNEDRQWKAVVVFPS